MRNLVTFLMALFIKAFPVKNSNMEALVPVTEKEKLEEVLKKLKTRGFKVFLRENKSKKMYHVKVVAPN